MGEFFISGQKVLIDDEDVMILEIHPWGYHEKLGVYCRDGEHIIYLHRLIMECPEDKVIDHKNRKNWDNQKENLRVCTRAENH